MPSNIIREILEQLFVSLITSEFAEQRGAVSVFICVFRVRLVNNFSVNTVSFENSLNISAETRRGDFGSQKNRYHLRFRHRLDYLHIRQLNLVGEIEIENYMFAVFVRFKFDCAAYSLKSVLYLKIHFRLVIRSGIQSFANWNFNKAKFFIKR